MSDIVCAAKTDVLNIGKHSPLSTLLYVKQAPQKHLRYRRMVRDRVFDVGICIKDGVDVYTRVQCWRQTDGGDGNIYALRLRGRDAHTIILYILLLDFVCKVCLSAVAVLLLFV